MDKTTARAKLPEIVHSIATEHGVAMSPWASKQIANEILSNLDALGVQLPAGEDQKVWALEKALNASNELLAEKEAQLAEKEAQLEAKFEAHKSFKNLAFSQLYGGGPNKLLPKPPSLIHHKVIEEKHPDLTPGNLVSYVHPYDSETTYIYGPGKNLTKYTGQFYESPKYELVLSMTPGVTPEDDPIVTSAKIVAKPAAPKSIHQQIVDAAFPKLTETIIKAEELSVGDFTVKSEEFTVGGLTVKGSNLQVTKLSDLEAKPGPVQQHIHQAIKNLISSSFSPTFEQAEPSTLTVTTSPHGSEADLSTTAEYFKASMSVDGVVLDKVAPSEHLVTVAAALNKKLNDHYEKTGMIPLTWPQVTVWQTADLVFSWKIEVSVLCGYPAYVPTYKGDN